jgi:putative membrane-bound dehydrogenase-like protein
LTPPAAAAEVKLKSQTFTLPDGFEVEPVAGPPLVDRPIVADFDELGRLYVADSSGLSEKAEKQLELKPHRIVRLEDTDGDGRFDKSTVFADKMMFPEGAMWLDGSLFVAAPPSIWKLTDTDGDGVADQRAEWFQGKTLTGCANDLHGPYLGPDGWIYWCKGAFAKQTYERPGKPPFVSRAAHIFRSRPDGSGIEAVMTGGMDNPVDVVFTPGGERIFTTTFFQQPEGGKRDGLIHAVYGGIYGKVNDVTSDHKQTGDLMPVLTHWGPAAPCGFTLYSSSAFGDEFQYNLFASLFNLHKVTRNLLEPDGATFRNHDSDFLVSDSVDFHPTDVVEDADGSLLVIDTGGWYKVCCPTSQLAKPDVLGTIYRVRRRGAPQVEDPRGLKLPWETLRAEELAKLLGDARPAVQNRAIHQLQKGGGASVSALSEALKLSSSALTRRNSVWALTRIEGDAAREAARKALADPDPTICQAAIHSASIWRDGRALDELEALLDCQSPHLQRSAAEAVGRIGDKKSVPRLLSTLARKRDRVLEHSLTYALIEIAAPAETRKGLEARSSYTKRAALIALDQMDGGELKADVVTPLLVSEDPLLKQTSSWIITHHTDWASALAGFFRGRLDSTSLSGGEREELVNELAQFARDPTIQELITATLRDAAPTKPSLSTSLRAAARAGLKEMPPSWARELTRLLRTSDGEVLRQAVAATKALPAPKEHGEELTEALLRIGLDTRAPIDLRVEALASVHGGLASMEPGLFDFLRAHLGPEEPVAIRGTAAEVLAKAKLSAEQLTALTASLGSAGPMEVPRLLPAFQSSSDEAVGLKLVSALKESGSSLGLRPDTIKPVLEKFPESVKKESEVLFASLNVDGAKQKAHLEELLTELKGGDVRRGQAIFNSTKAACSACHAIGYLGGKIGPDLTTIGQIRTERDLLESIVYPSVSFVRSYEPMVVVSKTGEVFSGVLRRDTNDEVILTTSATAEARIARSDIIQIQPGSVSIMPQGMDQQLSRQELADLLAFLKATKW